MRDRILGLPRNIFFLGLTSFFNDFSSEMVFAVFPAFFTSVLKTGAASLGIVDGTAEAVSNFFKIYSGHLSDRVQRRKPFVVSGYIVSVVTRPFYILISTVTGALGLRVLDRVGKGLRDAPRDAIISLSTPQEELGRSFGYHRAMDTTGAILGPLAAYFFLRYFPLRFDIVFSAAFLIGILAVLTLFFISDVTGRGISKGLRIGSFRQLSAQFKGVLLGTFVLAIGSLPIAVMLLKTKSLGLIIADIPLFYAVYSISYAVFSIPAGKISDRIGARAVISIGYLLLLGGYFIINRASSMPVLFCGFLFLGLFPAFTDGVQRSLAAQLSVPELRGGALGLMNASNGIGALLAGIIGGYLWQVYNPTTAFFAASVFIGIGLLIFLISARYPTDPVS